MYTTCRGRASYRNPDQSDPDPHSDIEQGRENQSHSAAVARQVLKIHRDGAVSYLARDLERSRAIMMPASNLCAVTWVDASKLRE